jgi:DNA-binding HxlR family transcriptional regulator
VIDLDGIDLSGRPGIAELAAEMARHGAGRDAPARTVMAMLGDRWTMLILLVLVTGEWRHAELQRIVARLSAGIERPISQRMLTLKLRALERDGFVLRSATGEVPPRVSYRLTPMGHELAAKARRLIDWINASKEGILAARSKDAAEKE